MQSQWYDKTLKHNYNVPLLTSGRKKCVYNLNQIIFCPLSFIDCYIDRTYCWVAHKEYTDCILILQHYKVINFLLFHTSLQICHWIEHLDALLELSTFICGYPLEPAEELHRPLWLDSQHLPVLCLSGLWKQHGPTQSPLELPNLSMILLSPSIFPWAQMSLRTKFGVYPWSARTTLDL